MTQAGSKLLCRLPMNLSERTYLYVPTSIAPSDHGPSSVSRLFVTISIYVQVNLACERDVVKVEDVSLSTLHALSYYILELRSATLNRDFVWLWLCHKASWSLSISI